MTNRATSASFDVRPPGKASAKATKDLYEIGEIPPLGHVPASM